MGLFTPKVPNTIDDGKWDGIKKAAGRAEAKSGGMFSPKAAGQRKATIEQKDNASKS